jgi:hypothetical protein
MLANLTDEDRARLDAQRVVVRTEIRARYGEGLRNDKRGFSQLQRLLDDKVFAANQTYELQCIGICWGDILCEMAPFQWMMITDEYGHDPTLQWRETSITIHALTMISKRVEDGEEVDVEWLAEKVIGRAQELESDAR